MYGSSPILMTTVRRGVDDRDREDQHDGDSIVVKDRWDIFRWEFVCCVANEQTGLSYSSITDNHTSRKPLAIQFQRAKYFVAPNNGKEGKETGINLTYPRPVQACCRCLVMLVLARDREGYVYAWDCRHALNGKGLILYRCDNHYA